MEGPRKVTLEQVPIGGHGGRALLLLQGGQPHGVQAVKVRLNGDTAETLTDGEKTRKEYGKESCSTISKKGVGILPENENTLKTTLVRREKCLTWDHGEYL